MKEYVIETRNVTKSYGSVLALNQVSLHVERGSIYGLIGDNGAGKSTLLKLLAGHVFATSGEISLFDKHHPKELEHSRRQIGTMIESPGFFPDLTVSQMLEYCRIQRGIPGKTKVEETLKLTGIWEKKNSKCKNLSLGQKQRLGLAIAMIGDPKILILDEPINGLDPSGILELRNLFHQLNEEKHITILLSSHILTELQQTADTFGFLSHGRLLEEISAEKLQEQCTDYLNIMVSDLETYTALLEKHYPEDCYKVLPDQTIQISNPKRDSKHYSQLAADHKLVLAKLEERRATLEEYYMNLKQGGEKTC
ncbi:MAG: ABC transporter ATP-binding protein [Lachnospiraceae bacterium]|nr:ABC transporter ATP-binding protein [Lachnospiraceae bacterium]